VRNLRQNLEAIGSELLVAHDRPENFLSTLVSADQKVKTTVVYQQEVCSEELAVEDQVIAALLSSNANVDFVSVWGSTLHHVDDLPYNPRKYLPNVYTKFVREGADTPVR
jgi:deoxyribodipyrimidine photo-lyase